MNAIEGLMLRVHAVTPRKLRYIHAMFSSYYVPMNNTIEVHVRYHGHMSVIRCERNKGEDLPTGLYKAILDVQDRASKAISKIGEGIEAENIPFYPNRLVFERDGTISYNRKGFTGIRKKI